MKPILAKLAITAHSQPRSQRRIARAPALPLAVTAALFASAAGAQSSLNLNGVVDGGVTAQTHASGAGGNNFKAVSGSVWNPSQLNFRGQEDLGGGLNAFFALGATFLTDTGLTLSKFFDRNSYVGISSPTWGSLAFGRQVTALADTIYVVDPFTTHNSGNNMNSRFGYVQAPGATIAGHFGPTPSTAPGIGLDRVDNSVKYSFRSSRTGIVGNLMMGAGEGVGGRAGGGMLGYDGSALTARASYMLYRDVDGVPFKAWATGATYKFPHLVVRASYVWNKIESGIDTAAKPYRNMETKVAGVGGTWTISLLDLNVAFYRGSRTQDGQPDQVARKLHLAPEYWLSKRTSLAAVAVFSRFNDAGSALDPSVQRGSSRSTYLGTAVTHRF